MRALDPLGEIKLTLEHDTDNPTRFVYRPWTVRELRQFQADLERDRTVGEMIEFFSERVKLGFVRCEGGDVFCTADDLDCLTHNEQRELVLARYRECFVSADDKKKSES